MNMNKSIRCALVVLVLLSICVSVRAGESPNPYIGRWALTIPGGGAGWLGVEQKDGYLDASILWGGGSVVPAAHVYVHGNVLFVTRVHRVEHKDDGGKVVRRQTLTETIVARASGDTLSLKQVRPNSNGKGASINEFTGERIAQMPPKPDLSRLEYRKPIVLFNGKNLDGWKLTNPGQTNGWSVEDGFLVNKPIQKKGKPHISYGNLRTVEEFEDFNLKLQVNVPSGGNSGIYLRGIYEVQVSDSYGKNLDAHNMGGIYSRITPTVNAEKPAGQWQSYDITLLDRHVTVKLKARPLLTTSPCLAARAVRCGRMSSGRVPSICRVTIRQSLIEISC
jgi:hypothetical protein